MDKILITILVVVALLFGGFYGYSYYNGAKIKDGVMSKSIDDKGRPNDMTTEFSPDDTIYFSAKGNRFWVNKAQVVWYKGEIALENRFLVEEEVVINKAGYYIAKLTTPEGLEEGQYSVTIYAAGNDIRETYAEFNIVK
jgi:hypothetical protein